MINFNNFTEENKLNLSKILIAADSRSRKANALHNLKNH